MKLESQVTSLELSKRLKELGVKQESIVWHYQEKTPTNPNQHEYGIPQADMRWRMSVTGKPSDLSTNRVYEEYAAFTVAELGEMLPRVVVLEGRPRWIAITNGQPTTERWYVSYDHVTEKPDYKLDTEADTEAEARAKMLIHLIENNLLTPHD